MAELVLQNVAKRYSSVTAVEGVNFTIREGEFFTLVGPSVCGKSTTLSMIAGLTDPSEGVIRLGATTVVDVAAGVNVPIEKRNLGMVFQSYALWPHMTVAQNLDVPLRLRKLPRALRRQRVEEAAHNVGLDGMVDRYPHELSGGQQQRVALARALVYQPQLLLLDEPLSNLDAKQRDRARAWLKSLQQKVGITTIYVTHDQLEALSLSDRIAVMSMGHVAQVGTPKEIYEAPATTTVASFVGRTNLLPGVIIGEEEAHAIVAVEGTNQHMHIPQFGTRREKGEKVTVAIRSERLQLTDSNTGAPDVVVMQLLSKSYVGARYEYELGFGNQVLQAESETDLGVAQIGVKLPPDSCLLFPAA